MRRRPLLFLAGPALAVLTACGGTQVAPPPTINSAEPVPGLAAAALVNFTSAVNGHPATSSFSPSERVAIANSTAIGIQNVTMRYIDASGTANADGSWTADVDLSWQVRGESTADEQIGVTFTPAGDTVQITGFGGAGLPVPLWLLAPVTVARQGGVTVICEGKDPGPYLQMGLTAIAQVRQTIAWPDAHLTLEVPADEATLEQVSGTSPGSDRGVAAFTGPVDGRVQGPVHIFVNPQVIGSGRDAQIVMSHEATHAATNASTNPHLPAWVREGFADYVALRAQNIPLNTIAGAALASVRKSGAPTTLPTDTEFNAMAEDFGQEYTFAWLAWRYLDSIGGPASADRFYNAVGAGTSVDQALQQTYGFNTDVLTARWRAYVLKLAG